MNQQFSSMFVSPDEQTVAILGNNTAQTFLSTGAVRNGFAILSNRRIYFQGECYKLKGKHYLSSDEKCIVDVQDVTGMGFAYRNPVWLKILSYTLFVVSLFVLAIWVNVEQYKMEILMAWVGVVVAMLVSFLMYKLGKRSIFEILFAGGGIAFNVSWFPKEEAEQFQKAIKQVSDARKAEMRAQPIAPSGSAADELSKLASLLQQGLISRQEFEMQKAKLFGMK